MSIQITHLQVVGSKNNAYAVDRHETWTVVKDRTFERMDDTRAYVVDANFRSLPGDFQSPDMRARCFPNEEDVLYKRLRYFIGPPNLTLMARLLQADGVRVVD